MHSHWLGGRRTSYGAGLLVSKFTGARSPELPSLSELFGSAEFWDKVLNMLHTHFRVQAVNLRWKRIYGQHCPPSNP
jgi:hypothetical protein